MKGMFLMWWSSSAALVVCRYVGLVYVWLLWWHGSKG